MASVAQTYHSLGSHDGHPTLVQTFRFRGESASARAIAELLMTAPLVGPDSIFGDRPGEELAPVDDTRALRGFSPAPGFRFDVDLSAVENESFLVHFSQPGRNAPYLQGDLVWTVSDVGDGCELDEQINTARAMETAREPLGGSRTSIRRWLFFRLGHRQVMNGATRNLAILLERP